LCWHFFTLVFMRLFSRFFCCRYPAGADPFFYKFFCYHSIQKGKPRVDGFSTAAVTWIFTPAPSLGTVKYTSGACDPLISFRSLTDDNLLPHTPSLSRPDFPNLPQARRAVFSLALVDAEGFGVISSSYRFLIVAFWRTRCLTVSLPTF